MFTHIIIIWISHIIYMKLLGVVVWLKYKVPWYEEAERKQYRILSGETEKLNGLKNKLLKKKGLKLF